MEAGLARDLESGWLGGPSALGLPVSVLIPVFQEAGALPGVLNDLETLAGELGIPAGSEVIVIDDGSGDGTVASDFLSAGSGAMNRRLVTHSYNLGYGAAVKTGLRAAKNDTIVLIDGDGTYPVRAIPDLLRKLDGADMVVAARTGAHVAIPAARRPAKWVLQKIAEYLAVRAIPDLNSGLRAFRKQEALRFMGLYPQGFSFTTTITLAYLCTDRMVTYHSIDYFARVSGQSKIRALRDTRRILVTIIRSVLAFNPLRVFLPVAGLFLVLALAVLLFVRDGSGNVTDGTLAVLLIGAMISVLTGLLADVVSRSRP
jgi:glycosyltransferase involved in cell wall biosynthesis